VVFRTHIVGTILPASLGKGNTMRSFLLLTQTGPVLLLTKCSSITEAGLVDLLSGRGIEKFIAFEVPVSKVHNLYGVPFEVVAADIDHGRDMRILDYNGQHIFESFSFDELGTAVAFEH
jgi:hypothetical protein